MVDYVDIWDEYSIEFCKKLEYQCGGDWSKLDETEQEIAALWKLACDMYMSGFDDFFLSWGFDCYSFAMRGIKRVADTYSDCNKVYKLFDKAYKRVFARFENDKRIKAYGDIAQYLNLKDRIILMRTFNAFDKRLGPILCESAYKYYCEKLKQKP